MSPGHGRRALVLCYHAVSPTWPAVLSVTPEAFAWQIRRLTGRGYRPVTFASALQAPPDEKVLAITFDDAYRSVLEHAAPVLARIGAPATIFAPTAHVGSGRPMAWPGIDRWLGTEHEPELLPLDWEELGRLADAGWEIGSHTETHPRLGALDAESLRRELSGSRRTCEERLGRPCPSVAYPYGEVDGRVAAAAVEAGYRFGAALTVSAGEPRALHWPRIGVYHGEATWRFELKVAAPVPRLLDSRTAGPLVAAALAQRGRWRRRRVDAPDPGSPQR